MQSIHRIEKANKRMDMIATAYNLKKYLKFIDKTSVSMAGIGTSRKRKLKSTFSVLKWLLWKQISYFKDEYQPIMLNMQCTRLESSGIKSQEFLVKIVT